MAEKNSLQPGNVFRIRRGPVSTTQLVKYASASGDFNRIHFDQPFALEAGLKGVIAHGMLTMGFAASCLSEAIGPQVFLKRISARFLSPVWVGDAVDVTATVSETTAEGESQVELEARVGDKTVLRGKATAVLVAATLDKTEACAT
ncbi:MaoC/PaaZ C-terminal domain-containing protein [Noviherbaspirillum sp.]|uniref:MaoC/PaaZ C-terminal domain-containing protein n=1 Tax=Noviherbaspirillum sp. TaxID=1926288 RepID=UPI002D3EACF8|nr:MaoC/PaaZ C-terminal domain-containing protein [Noviherbaspirillum sp.]HZW21858.1 MaoC/PaaZ C-terminal domain-containing protein [Noviherbaspirillum sp.]